MLRFFERLLEPTARGRIMDARERFLRARLAALTGVEAGFALNRYAEAVTAHMRAEAESELQWISHLRTMDKIQKG